MFDISAIMLQTPAVVTGIPALDSLVALITAIAGIVVAVGAVTHSLSLRPELAKHKQALGAAADFMKDVGTHTTQSIEDIGTLAKVTYDMLPEQAQKIVNAQNIRLAELNKKAEQARDEIGKIPGALDHI